MSRESVSFRFHQDKGVKIVNTKITFITFANNSSSQYLKSSFVSALHLPIVSASSHSTSSLTGYEPIPFYILLYLQLLSSLCHIMAGELFNSILSTPARLFRSASGRTPEPLLDPDDSSPSVARQLYETPSSFTFSPTELASMLPKDRLALGRLLRSPLPIKYSGLRKDRHVFQHLVVSRARDAGWQRFTVLSLPGLGSIDDRCSYSPSSVCSGCSRCLYCFQGLVLIR